MMSYAPMSETARRNRGPGPQTASAITLPTGLILSRA
jgi:hypothetical protein